jgi:hypothetical protein
VSLNYMVLEQTAEQIRETENSPSVSMWPHLVNTAQTRLINQISIYMEPGETPERARVLYMNATALEVWTAMKRSTVGVREVHRPPRAALLIFGMPFSE